MGTMKIISYLMMAFGYHVHCCVPKDIKLYKKQVITLDKYLITPFLQSELQTCQQYGSAIQTLQTSIATDLLLALSGQEQLLSLAASSAEGRAANCFKELGSFTKHIAKEEAARFKQCTATSTVKQEQKLAEIERNVTAYNKTKQTFLDEFDSCRSIFSNKNSQAQRIKCVEKAFEKFREKVSVFTTNGVFKSFCMESFQLSVLPCISHSVERIGQETKKWLTDISHCGKLSDSNIIDLSPNVTENIAFLAPTVSSQISQAGTQYNMLWAKIRSELGDYCSLELEVRDEYNIGSRSRQDFHDQLTRVYSNYYGEINQTLEDYLLPEDRECAIVARKNIDNVILEESEKLATCDAEVVSDTERSITEVEDKLLHIFNKLPEVGNVAILKCLQQGFIFAENFILECYNFEFMNFTFNWHTAHCDIQETMNKLKDRKKSYFNGPDSLAPCGPETMERMELKVIHEIYKCKRCLYKRQGAAAIPSTSIALKQLKRDFDIEH